MNTATITQDEIDKAGTPEARLKLLESKGIPVKGKNLNTEDYYIEVIKETDYRYEWSELDAKD